MNNIIETFLPPESRTLYDYLTEGTPLHWLDSQRLEKEKAIYQKYTPWQKIGMAALCATLNFPKRLLISRIAKSILLKDQGKAIDKIAKELGPLKYFFIATLVGPIVEELIFRSSFQDLIQRISSSSKIQIGLTHALFSLLHDDRKLFTFLYSGSYSTKYYSSQNLLPSIASHMANNFFASLLRIYTQNT